MSGDDWDLGWFWGFGIRDRHTPVVLVHSGLHAWMLWQVLRGPALPRAERLPPGVAWLRRLLYAGIAGDLLLWSLVDILSDTVADLGESALWIATVVLLFRVISGIPAWFRVVAVALSLAGLVSDLFGRLPPVGIVLHTVAGSALTVMILIGQFRDGRWSAVTIGIGQISLIPRLIFPLIILNHGLGELYFSGLATLFNALGVFFTVWMARTAHELARPDAAVRPVVVRAPRVYVAFVLALPVLVVGSEESARFSFTPAPETCPAYADPRDAFLCLARSEENAVRAPMFPTDQPDQRVLAHGADLCALPTADERQARLDAVGGSAEPQALATALEFLCPGILARQKADEARVQAEHDRVREREQAEWKAYLAKKNARCSDPWRRQQATRQGSAAYLLFEGGGYAVFDDRDEGAGEAADIFKAIDDGFIDAVGTSAYIMTFGENEPMCLTLKAFKKAPPLRLKGWDKVVEVGIASRTGRLVVPPYPDWGDSGAIGPLPNLAVTGPGKYRMRVYARELPWDDTDPDAPAEEHLIVVYPGRSTEKITWR
ncbi:hypothetical protein ACIBEJ_39850 [Nonomuraea sp. NPDC050790]|uniref:hypothetical protein n=1 Tax=Nonomuraea sp. NPDC050790 TaxID=3364371 RepID=UPI003792C2AF